MCNGNLLQCVFAFACISARARGRTLRVQGKMCLHLWIFYAHGEALFAPPPEPIYRSYPTVFRCQTVTNRGEGALASCLDMELENVEKAACGSGGMDGYGRAWSVDKEADSCYWAAGWRAEKGVGKGVAGGGPHRPFIYFDPRSTGGPGRAHAKLPRRAELPCPLSHLSARPSVSS